MAPGVVRPPRRPVRPLRRCSRAGELKILRVGSECVLADGLNAAMAIASGRFCAKFDDDDYYGANYLLDSMLAFEYLPSIGVVGKRAFFAYLQESDQTVLRFKGGSYQLTNRVHGGTLLWDRERTGELPCSD